MRLGCPLYILVSSRCLLPVRFWLLHTWWLADLFSEKSVRWTFAVQNKALLKTVLISLMSSLFCCLNARWWPSGISTAILVSLTSSAHEGCCCFSSRRVEYLCFFLPSYLCGDKGQAQTLLSIPPTQQPVLALCRWPESPQDWQTDKARNLYPATGEELTAAISSMFLLHGGNCQALTRRADHLERKKKKSFLPRSLWCVGCEFQFLISEVCYQRPKCAAVCMYGSHRCRWLCHVMRQHVSLLGVAANLGLLFWRWEQNDRTGARKGGKGGGSLPGHRIPVESSQFMYYSKSRFCS